jgi:hypothetical protein
MPLSDVVSTMSGALNFRVLGTWVNSLTTNDGSFTIEYVKSQGYSFGLGVPEWRVNGSIGYQDKTFGALLRARYISAGNYNSTVNIINNHIKAYTYFDLQTTIRIPTKAGGPQMELYGNVTNLFDKDPPISSLYSPYYDVIGRYITVGARVRF